MFPGLEPIWEGVIVILSPLPIPTSGTAARPCITRPQVITPYRLGLRSTVATDVPLVKVRDYSRSFVRVGNKVGVADNGQFAEPLAGEFNVVGEVRGQLLDGPKHRLFHGVVGLELAKDNGC